MIQDSIQDSTRYVVSEIHHGNIMPGNRAEMLRDVFLLSNANVQGGIYAHELSIDGANIKVEKSVYASKSIIIKNSQKTKSKISNTFFSTVSASESILVENNSNKSRFLSDIYTNKLHLVNSIVFGNVFAHDAFIKNSIILGSIYCKNNLEIENAIYSTFRVKNVKLGQNLFQLFPVALSESPIDIPEPIRLITFLNILKIESNDSGIVKLDVDDVFEINTKAQTVKLPKNIANDETDRLYCLSITERVLNSHKIIEHFKYNKMLIEALALNSHLDSSYINENFKKPIQNLEDYLWDILKGRKTIKNIDGYEKFDAIVHRIFNT